MDIGCIECDQYAPWLNSAEPDVIDISRRRFVSSLPAVLGGASILSACSPGNDPQGYEAVAAETRRGGAVVGPEGVALGQELVRYATLAPSSHNTQCWKFALENRAITILPDPLRRCPAVDPDDHHVFVSLGCATENLVHAALAHGFKAEAAFDTTRETIRVALAPIRAEWSPLFKAIPARQCTRGDYDSKPLSNQELSLLERAGTSNGVRTLLITERPELERVLDYVVQANTAQMADPAFVREIRSWIRFNGIEAVHKRDGLYSASTGNPNIPTWLGELAFDWIFRSKRENDRYARQIRSSAGIAVIVGQSADKAHWVEVGRCYERFALQATALGIRNALVNQPVEVQAVRPRFATAFGLTGQRPDLIVRFGRGPTMPSSLRRPVQDVLV
jgi:hypothetical protein